MLRVFFFMGINNTSQLVCCFESVFSFFIDFIKK